MIEGYCVKCKARRPVADAVEEQMKNGRKAVKGKCPVCGAVMFKILGGKSVVHPSPAEDSGQPLSEPTSAEDSATDGIVPSAPAPG